MLQTSNHLQTNPTITIIQTNYLGFLIPVKSFSQQREKQFIVLFKVARQLLQQIFGHSRFWSPFTGTETFVPGNIIFHWHRPDQRGEERREELLTWYTPGQLGQLPVWRSRTPSSGWSRSCSQTAPVSARGRPRGCGAQSKVRRWTGLHPPHRSAL